MTLFLYEKSTPHFRFPLSWLAYIPQLNATYRYLPFTRIKDDKLRQNYFLQLKSKISLTFSKSTFSPVAKVLPSNFLLGKSILCWDFTKYMLYIHNITILLYSQDVFGAKTVIIADNFSNECSYAWGYN